MTLFMFVGLTLQDRDDNHAFVKWLIATAAFWSLSVYLQVKSTWTSLITRNHVALHPNVHGCRYRHTDSIHAVD